MKNTKALLAAALIAACAISQPVLAQVAESAPLPAHTVTLESTDLNFAFEQTTQPLQMATLSEQEMKETEGAILPVLIPLGMSMLGGAALGSTLYGGSVLYSSWDGSSNLGLNGNTFNNFGNNFSSSDLAWAAGGGAVGGAYSGALFRGVGIPNFIPQLTAPLTVQVPIRTGGAGVGFSTFGVHGYPTTNFNSGGMSGSSTNFYPLTCGSCYRGQ